MLTTSQTLEAPVLSLLVDPDCAETLRETGALSAQHRDTKLTWQVATSRGAVKERLVRDDDIRVVLLAVPSETDPLLRDLARNAERFASHPWLHVVALTAQLTPALIAQLRHFASWSILSSPCCADELADALAEAAGKSTERHRLSMLSAAIRAEAEDILARTRNIVGALRDGAASNTLGNLVRIADRIADDMQAAPAARTEGSGAAPHQAQTAGFPSHLTLDDVNKTCTRQLIGLCSTRQNFFPEGLFSDPAWDMLLDLTHARLGNKRISVSSLCIAARVPATTALRRIGDLVSQGLVVRVRDESDGRRVFVELTDDGLSRMTTYIDSVRGAFAFDGGEQLRKA